jgi:hypothetical protein
MSDITAELQQQVGQPEGVQLEYKPILIPARNMAMIMASMANAAGGYLIFGVKEKPGSSIEVRGLSNDFKVTSVVHKALDMLSPKPEIANQYFTYQDKELYGIKITASTDKPILLTGVRYVRMGDAITTPDERPKPKIVSYPRNVRISSTAQSLDAQKKGSTGARSKFLDHYLSILKLYAQGENNLYPENFITPTTVPEGQVLSRILFSSCVDTFETYLSDLLYEIYLAVPDALKAGGEVKVADVMACADREEFIQWYAAKRVGSLQKGSVKGFLEDNAELKQLKALTADEMKEIEKILQIRHLYTHRNGVVDEKFLIYFKGKYVLGAEHLMTMQETLDTIDIMVSAVSKIDGAAASKYDLSTNEP